MFNIKTFEMTYAMPLVTVVVHTYIIRLSWIWQYLILSVYIIHHVRVTEVEVVKEFHIDPTIDILLNYCCMFIYDISV